ncbi:MAG: 5-oxoprolinase [Methanobacteriota archaeon]|nr:MAG: 5-oxoprolinase [Euryarchaeota archaeon]
MSKWFFAVDRGGTFTDVIGVDTLGKIHTSKVLSESTSYDDSVIAGIRQILQLSSEEKIPLEKIERVRIGTTIATNALLEHKGSKTALLITSGFKDLLEIGNQARPSLFDLSIVKPAQLYHSVTEVEERLGADGNIIRKLDERKLELDLINLYNSGIQSVAIVLMHSWKNPVNEERCYNIAKKVGFSNISISSRIMPLIKIVGRGQTTVVDSYLYPILSKYILSLRNELGDIPLEFMQSSGGLTDGKSLTGKDAILSGPAGGAIGCATVGEINRLDSIIGFDMGGTSTDVSRYDGHFSRITEVETGGINFQASSLDIETIAAGGGSLLWFDGQRLQVGPESAGAIPGPVCYGLEGQLAVTDANLVLGRINPNFFPKVFGPEQNDKLNSERARFEFEKLRSKINKNTNSFFSLEELAKGFLDIANEKMAEAIKKVSVSRGYDVRDHALVCFGGAAPQHCCSIAKILGIKQIVIHPLSSLLSAYGIANAEQFRYGVKSLVEKFDSDSHKGAFSEISSLESPLIDEIQNLGILPENITTKKYLDLRMAGTDTPLTIPFIEYKSMLASFGEKHRALFGFFPSNELEIANVRVEVTGHRTKIGNSSVDLSLVRPEPIHYAEVYFDKNVVNTPFYSRESLPVGFEIPGPAIIIDSNSTIDIEPGFTVSINNFGHLVINQKVFQKSQFSSERDAISLEIFNNLFMSIAEQMGFTLQNTAHSINIKERLDFSCALFDGHGNLVANAPHVPVHLGAMSESVKSIISANKGKMKNGDYYLINNPHKGGSHLPDLTVIAPVFSGSIKPIFYVASRGHHADIGGITPGSIPPFSKTIYEEGIIIDNFLIVSKGKLREKEFEKILLSSENPARNIEERKHDINAQIAAVSKGIHEIRNMIEKYELSTVQSYMKYIRENSAEAMSDALKDYLGDDNDKEKVFEDFLDDGSKISVKIKIVKKEGNIRPFHAIVDFSGTDSQMDNNLNAPIAVTKAAVLYVFRLLINKDIPLNSGCLDQIEIIIPKGSLLNPSDDAAVVGGNVETSQRITDTLLGALGIAAASQGTMNNFVFGSEDNSGKQYYETIAGGSGATDGFSGASAVQVHMTNTRSTDPEILEHRFREIRLEKFEIRKNSGGNGQYKGGNGVIREISFLEPRKVSIVSERRNIPPYGISGGESASCGSNILRQASGEEIDLGGKVERVVKSGETVIIRTPGGGGFGSKT